MQTVRVLPLEEARAHYGEVEDGGACGHDQFARDGYQQIRQAAAKTHRPLDDVLAEAVAAVAPVLDTPLDRCVRRSRISPISMMLPYGKRRVRRCRRSSGNGSKPCMTSNSAATPDGRRA